MDSAARALVELGRSLRERGYQFTTVTPSTHARVNARPGNARAVDLRGVFGWSRPFTVGQDVVPEPMLRLMQQAGVLLEEEDGSLRSAVRFSSLGPLLFVHSAFPTQAADSVFFGPDTYRFAAVLRREVSRARRVVDVGCGSGAGGLVVAATAQIETQLVLADINGRALQLAAVNAELNGFSAPRVTVQESNILRSVEGAVDLVISNPPFLVDSGHRAYRHGGTKGIELSVRIATEAVERLVPGGRLILYTATPVVEGRDLLRLALEPLLPALSEYRYEELDPDIFGEELDGVAYADTERLALVAFMARRG